jgi:DNA-binding MarR family transcriptional regulator
MTQNNIPQTQTDREYILLTEIEANNAVSQRELSQKAGLSLGSVNILLKKMVKQGLIKMESIPANRVVYMLTPAGIAEKAMKTIRYIKVHYKVIEETKDRIIDSLTNLHLQYNTIYILQPEDELNEILQQAIEEYRNQKPHAAINLISNTKQISQSPPPPNEKIALLTLAENLVLDQVEKEYRKQITKISLMELF